MGKETVLALLLREKGHFVSGEAVSAELGTAGAAMLTLPEVHPRFAAGQFATSLFSRILGAAKPLLIGKRILPAATAGGRIARDGTIRRNVVDRPLGQ